MKLLKAVKYILTAYGIKKEVHYVGECIELVKPHKSLYPVLSIKGTPYSGNRLVLASYKGCEDESLYALHTCDNKACINPEHLYWGTQSQNIKDSIARHPTHLQNIRENARKGIKIKLENIRNSSKVTKFKVVPINNSKTDYSIDERTLYG